MKPTPKFYDELQEYLRANTYDSLEHNQLYNRVLKLADAYLKAHGAYPMGLKHARQRLEELFDSHVRSILQEVRAYPDKDPRFYSAAMKMGRLFPQRGRKPLSQTSWPVFKKYWMNRMGPTTWHRIVGFEVPEEED